MRYAWLVGLALGIPFVTAAVFAPAYDGDRAWEMWLGKTIETTHHIPRALGAETFAASGAPWTPQEWLFSIGLASATGATGWAIFASAIALCAIGALLLTAWRACRLGAAPLDVAIVTTLAGIGLFDSFAVRAQVVGWLMLALFLLALDEETPWMWAAVPLAAIWSNIHASAMLAPLLACAVFAGRGIEDRAWTPRVRMSASIALCVAAAICCNPFGVGLPLYALSLFGSGFKRYVMEWQVTDISWQAFFQGALPLLLSAVVFGLRPIKRSAWRVADMLHFALFTFLLFFAVRNISLYGIVVAPMVALASTEFFGRMARPPFPLRERLLLCGLGSFIALLGVANGLQLRNAFRHIDPTMPVSESVALVRMPGEHRVFCEDFTWCGFFIASARERVFMDGRVDPYPPSIWEKYRTIILLRTGWREMLSSYDIDAVMVHRGEPLDQALALTGDWRQVARDARFRLWMRGGAR